jgi:hypothetical protein
MKRVLIAICCWLFGRGMLSFKIAKLYLAGLALPRWQSWVLIDKFEA